MRRLGALRFNEVVLRGSCSCRKSRALAPGSYGLGASLGV